MSASSRNTSKSAYWLLFLVLLAVMFWAGMQSGQWYAQQQINKLAQTEQRLQSVYTEVESLTRQINMLNVELEIEKMAAVQARDDLSAAQAVINEQKRELTFFEKVMAPEREANGVVFDSFELIPMASEGRYRFRLALAQLERSKRFAKGSVSAVLQGTDGQSSVSHDLLALAGIDAEGAKFSFQYFKIFEGEFTLPGKFTPEAVAVKATFPKSRWQKYAVLEERYDWQ